MCNTAFVTATKLNPSALNQWVSNIESTWSEWKNAATNPEHMAAVQLTREILQSDNEDWRSWALNFTTTQGDDHPFIVLTETKFSFRCIPVGIGTLLTGLGLKKKHM